jgi:choline kinase
MRACILAAGIGQRLRPLTDDKPKALVEVGGKSFLDRLIAQLVAVGVRELVVATGWCEPAVAAALKDAPIPVILCRNDAFDRTQNSVSLHVCAEALLRGRPQDTFKLDGDVIIDVEVLRRLKTSLVTTRAGLVAAIDPRPGLGAEEMKVTLAEESDAITAFGKHLDPRASAGESIGVELIAAEAVSPILDALGALVTSGETGLYYEDVYDRLLVTHGGSLDARAIRVGDLPWTEVDTAEDLQRAGEIARKTRLC